MGGVGQDGQSRWGARPHVAVGPASLEAKHLRDVLEPVRHHFQLVPTFRKSVEHECDACEEYKQNSSNWNCKDDAENRANN